VSPQDAFEICHEIYRKARHVLDNRLPTVVLDQQLGGDAGWRPSRTSLAEYAADFALAGRKALASPRQASRRMLFEIYYLGAAEYQRVRKHLRISELTWANWTDEIRSRVGRELLKRGLFPPRSYFRDPSI
jgi:hypothetical protein